MKLKKEFVALYACVLIATIGYGISFPLLSISLDKMGVSGRMIGLNAAMPALGWLIGAFYLPKLQANLGQRLLLLICLLLASIALIGFSYLQDVWAWMLLRFIFGGSLGMFYRAVEYWINAVSENSVRGRNIGIYAVCFMFGIAVGSALQPVLGTVGLVPYGVILGFFVIAAIIILRQEFEKLPELDLVHSVLSPVVIWAAPIALIGIFAYGMVEDIPAYLMSVYALRNELGEDIAAFTLTAVAIGNLVFPIPIGILSDRMNRETLLIILSVLAAIIVLFIPLTLANSALFLGLLVVWGGMLGSIYMTSLAIIGDRYKDDELAVANANFGIVYAMGALIGPLINGAALDTLESHGMIVSAAIIFGSSVLISLFLRKTRRAVEV